MPLLEKFSNLHNFDQAKLEAFIERQKMHDVEQFDMMTPDIGNQASNEDLAADDQLLGLDTYDNFGLSRPRQIQNEVVHNQFGSHEDVE